MRDLAIEEALCYISDQSGPACRRVLARLETNVSDVPQQPDTDDQPDDVEGDEPAEVEQDDDGDDDRNESA